jgi:hypothetical protein
MAKDWQRKLQSELKKEAFKEFEGWDSDHFISHIIGLREEIESLKEQLEQKEPGDSQSTQKQLSESNYKQSWTFATKIHFFLALHQKPLTSEDLHGYLMRIDEHYKDYENPRNNLSVTLGRVIKSGRIKRIKLPGIKHLYFALPEWIDPVGNLKQQYATTIDLFNNFFQKL